MHRLVNPAWIEHQSLQDSEVVMLDQREVKFFTQLIDRYLYPLVEDKDHQKKMVRDLKALRNNGCFIFFMINTLWLVIIFSLQLVSERIRDYVFIPIKRLHNDPLRFEPLGFAFLGFFASILLVQFISMLWHRYGTLLHLLASTDLKICQANPRKQHRHARREGFQTDNIEDAVEQVKALQQLKGFDEEDLPEPEGDDLTSKQVSEPDLSTTGLVYRGSGLEYMKRSSLSDMQRNLDTNSSTIERLRSSHKRRLYNKSLDHVFKSRYQALSQNKGPPATSARTKIVDVFPSTTRRKSTDRVL